MQRLLPDQFCDSWCQMSRGTDDFQINVDSINIWLYIPECHPIRLRIKEIYLSLLATECISSDRATLHHTSSVTGGSSYSN